MTEQRPDGRSVPLVWVGLDDEQIAFANQIVVQHHANEFYISFGQASPPPILGSDEERREAMERVEFVPVKTVARIGLTAQRMTEFVRVMQENLSQYEQQRGLTE